MAERKPLAGWDDCELPAHRDAMVLSVEPTDDGSPIEWGIDGSYWDHGWAGGDAEARIAAEDAARAMVAEMAAALGGSVTWADAQEDTDG